MDLRIAGRVALVTGSSRGLGRAVATSLSREGVRIVLCARGEEALRDAEASMPGESLGIVADVTDPATPERLAGVAAERFGGLHILVANAGGPPSGRALEPDDAAFEAALNANLMSSIRLVRAAVPHMRAAGWGRVVLLASRAVKQPIPTLTLSNTARTGLWAWAKTAAQDLFPDGITVNVAAPGTHRTERALELGLPEPMGEPANFGDVVVSALCSEQSRFVSGVALQIDGAETLGLL